MKRTQGSFIAGYVTVLVKGNSPELFFQECIKHGITIWNIKKISTNSCIGNVNRQDVNNIQMIGDRTNYYLEIVNRKGVPFIVKRFLRTKEVLLAVLLSVLFVIILSNILWKVTVIGVSQEIEEKITKKIESYGIRPGSWVFSIDSPATIQQNLVNDIPELLWVGVHKKGTTFILEGIEKTIVKEEKISGPQHLIASKNGVIQKMYVSKGLPKVRVNDYVGEGDILVSGLLRDEEDKKEDEDKSDQESKVVSATGEVMANTWYEVDVSIPLNMEHESLTGLSQSKYFIELGNIQIPIWGFRTPNYRHTHQELNRNDLYLFKWKTPLTIVESILSEKVYNKIKRTKDEAINSGMKQAKNELQLKLDSNATILSEKILHETTENGKVNLVILMSVEEDIAKAEPITQGD